MFIHIICTFTFLIWSKCDEYAYLFIVVIFVFLRSTFSILIVWIYISIHVGLLLAYLCSQSNCVHHLSKLNNCLVHYQINYKKINHIQGLVYFKHTHRKFTNLYRIYTSKHFSYLVYLCVYIWTQTIGFLASHRMLLDNLFHIHFLTRIMYA